MSLSSSDESKVIHQPPPVQYGTFQGVANYPPHTVIGYPQPLPPPAYARSYHSVPGYAVVEGRPLPHRRLCCGRGFECVPRFFQTIAQSSLFRYAVDDGRPLPLHRLPCCGLGCGWFLFIIGFFLGTIPWYMGAFILLCVRPVDPREEPGYIVCAIAAVLATVAIIFGISSQGR